jgi:hypothetical protein
MDYKNWRLYQEIIIFNPKMNKAVYIGARYDIVPMIVLDTIQEFIYIDSLPRSDYGIHYFEDRQLERKWFLPELKNILNRNGFECIKEKENYLEYNNKKGQTLKYHINTPFPDHITDDIQRELEPCENLILCGFDPNKIILKYMPNLKHIYCNQHTVYISDEYENNESKEVSVFRELSIRNYDYKYYLLKETRYHEEWNPETIQPGLKDIFVVETCDGLDNYFLDAPKDGSD